MDEILDAEYKVVEHQIAPTGPRDRSTRCITLNCPHIRVALSASSYPHMPGMLMSVIRISIRRLTANKSKAKRAIASANARKQVAQ